MKPTVIITAIAVVTWVGSALFAAVPLPVLPRMVPAVPGLSVVAPAISGFPSLDFHLPALEERIHVAALVRVQA
jgi:hypothetical protein